MREHAPDGRVIDGATPGEAAGARRRKKTVKRNRAQGSVDQVASQSAARMEARINKLLQKRRVGGPLKRVRVEKTSKGRPNP